MDRRGISRGISYIVRDADRFPVAYVYFESAPGRRAAANLITKDEARKIANGIGHLPQTQDEGQRDELAGVLASHS